LIQLSLISHQALFKLIPKEKQASLPSDENTPEKRAEKLWSIFDKKDSGKKLKMVCSYSCYSWKLVTTMEYIQ